LLKSKNKMFFKDKKKYSFFSQLGFTFIETIFTVAFLIVAIIIIIQTFSLALNIEKYNQMETQAVFLAQNKIEEKNAQTYQNIDCCGTYQEGSLDTPFENFSRVTKVYCLDDNLATTTIDTGLKKIEVTVSWHSFLNIRKNQVTIATLSTER
jgi:Tfp pilus assembly protein PilE